MRAVVDENDGHHNATPEKDSRMQETRPDMPDSESRSEDDEDEIEEEIEPRLKYNPLTRNLSGVYRNGDATSSFLVSGDKMVRYKSCWSHQGT